MWFSRKRQISRFEIIINQLVCVKTKSVNTLSDIGCGYGAFFDYLYAAGVLSNWRYVGYDVSSEVIKFCKEKFNSKALFYRSPVPIYKSDFSVMSGTFNFFPDKNLSNWETYFKNSLKSIWSKTENAMIFNLQVSNEKRITNKGIVYADSHEIENFCSKNFGKTSLIVEPSLPNDATFLIKR